MALQHKTKCNITPIGQLPPDVLHLFRPPALTKEAYLSGAVLDPDAEVLSLEFTLGVVRIECFCVVPEEAAKRKRGTEEVSGFVRIGFTFSPPTGSKATAVRARVVETGEATDMLVFPLHGFGPLQLAVLANVPREGEPHSIAYIKADVAPDPSWTLDPSKKGDMRKAG